MRQARAERAEQIPLFGYGPWGSEDVARATSVPPRTLHEWHKRGIAVASAATDKRGCLRYQREDVVRACRIQALRECGIGAERALELCVAMDAKVSKAFHVEPRPVVTLR